MDILTDIYKNYGLSKSHIKFVEEFKYLNALYYVVKSVDKDIEKKMKEAVMDAKQSSKDGRFALGMVTNPISAKKFESIIIPGDEAEAISNNVNGFLEMIIKHSIIAAHRGIITYCLDILKELDEAGKIILTEEEKKKIYEKRLRPEELSEIIKKYIINLEEDLKNARRLWWLGELRNLLEHNNGNCTGTYLKVKDEHEIINVGEKVIIDLKKLGYSFAIIDHTEKIIEGKVVAKYYT